jgi:alanine racemase
MDMIMVDLGPGGEGPPAAVGDEVVLFGAGGPSAFELARWADTITYEIVCGITERVTRRYHEAV